MTSNAAGDLDELLELAQRLADKADEMAMARFRAHDLIVERKPDLSPVTEVDRNIETELRRLIAAERPGDGVVGEEFDDTPPDGHWRWVIDPIDGTKSFVRGNELWACLISLQYDHENVVAVASMPALGHRYHATRGGGAHLNGERLAVSTVDTMEAAMLAHTSLSGFTWCQLDEELISLARRCWDARGFGNSMSHLAVARGTADIAWTSRAQEWDFAALSLIVEEAGGRFTDPQGKPPLGGGGISSNGHLHDAVLEHVRG